VSPRRGGVLLAIGLTVAAFLVGFLLRAKWTDLGTSSPLPVTSASTSTWALAATSLLPPRTNAPVTAEPTSPLNLRLRIGDRGALPSPPNPRRIDLASAFTREDRAENWAPATEELLVDQFDAFVSEKTIFDVHLSSVECRTTTCRIDISYDSTDAAEHLQGALFARHVLNLDCPLHSAGLDKDNEQTLYFICTPREE
jgi:hypothetical protein